MNDWTVMECLIVLAVFLLFIVIGALITALIELYNRLNTYERPVRKVRPSEWTFPADDWDDRITRG